MELPINIIVILALAVLVLLAVAAFFISGFNESNGGISDTSALNQGCGVWRAQGCEQGCGGHLIPFILIQNYDPKGNSFDADNDGRDNDGTLREACRRVVYGGITINVDMTEEGDFADACQKYCCGYVKRKVCSTSTT